MRWVEKTHGTKFELIRHFLATMFDSEMFSTRGQWSKVAVGALALALPAGMLLLDPPYFHKPVAQTAENLRAVGIADQLAILTFVFSITGFLALLAWQSLFPSRRDYLALAALPVLPRQIFAARFASVTLLSAVISIAMGLLPTVMAPHQFTARVSSPLIASVAARAVSSSSGCLFIFFAIVALQGVLINTLPARLFTRVSTYVQGALVAVFFLAGLYSWFIVEWREVEIARLSDIGAWAPPVWFVGLHQRILGDGKPFYAAMAARGLEATAGAVVLAGLMYMLAYRRYRKLLIESPDGATYSRGRRRSLLRLLSSDPRQQAVIQFLAAVLSRSQAHRMVVTAYVGAAVAIMLNSVLLAGAARRWPGWRSVFQFVVLYWPIALSFIVLAGVRHAFSMPAERQSNWIFQTTESQGRRAWMTAVERFVAVFVIAPIHLATLPVAAAVFGWPIAARMIALQALISLTAFETLFFSWQKLPFTCSYAPGKRPLAAMLTSWIAVLGVLVPLLSRLVASVSQIAEVFALFGGIFLAVWIWARKQRREGWGESKLIYEDQDSAAVDLGIKDMMYRGAEPARPEVAAPAPAPEAERVVNRPVAISLRFYRAVVRSFPHEFKNIYEEELVQVTEDAIEPIWRRYGVLGLARLLADAAIRVPAEYLSELRQDLRYGLRMLAAAPGFTAVAVVSLGMGIGMGTAPLSFINATILRNVPGVQKPGELITLRGAASYPNYQRYRERNDLFSSALAYAPAPFKISLEGRTERIWGHLVTPSYFSTLGVGPAMGRVFDERSDEGGAAPEVVVSHRFWQDHFGSNASATGKTLRINGQLFTIIGVGPAEFLGASPLLYEADLWLPLSAAVHVAPELADNALGRRDAAIFRMVGRLKPGVKPGRAEVALDTVARQIEQAYGDHDASRKGRRVEAIAGGRMVPFREENLAMLVTAPIVLVGLMLLVACSNVANMMLARGASRRREIAVRLALGASRARLIRQLLTESMLVATGAGVLGFLFAVWLMRLLSQGDVMRFSVQSPYPIPVSANLAPDGRALLFTICLAVFTGLAFGLAPAFRSTRADLTSSMNDGGSVRWRKHGRWSLRNILLVSQMAAALTLLLITGILARGYQRAFAMDVGFNPNHLYTISLDPVRDGYSGPQAAALFANLLERLRRQPSITAVSLSNTSPMWSPSESVTFSAVGAEPGRSPSIGSAEKYAVSAGYFDTLGIPIQVGRGFRKDDETGSSVAVIVNERLARDFWKEQSPLGRRIEIGRKAFQVVGVTRNAKITFSLGKVAPAIYFPLRPENYARPSFAGVTVMARIAPGVDGLEPLRREIAAIDPNVMPFYGFRMVEQVDRLMYMSRIGVSIHTFDGLFGLILAMIGLAGMTAYSVAQRSREIGIRIALGAQKADILGLVMKEGAALVMIGGVIGLAAAWAGIRLLSGITFAMATTTGGYVAEPGLWVATTLLLGVLALIACYVPARKSLRVDPVVSLRQE